ncbi:MAG: hypothetical protein KJ058_11295, partial [Thermoanaerobaculia bacterium]|nr:hypothetical protein [Thermoanaerobaculia bacterium]
MVAISEVTRLRWTLPRGALPGTSSTAPSRVICIWETVLRRRNWKLTEGSRGSHALYPTRFISQGASETRSLVSQLTSWALKRTCARSSVRSV